VAATKTAQQSRYNAKRLRITPESPRVRISRGLWIGERRYRPMIVPSFSTSVAVFLRSLITKVLFSPRVDHGPRGTSLNSTNLQSVTSVDSSPRKSRTAGETSRPAPLLRFGFGRALPKTYCQWSVRNGPASSHCAYATRLPLRMAIQRPLQVETAGP